MNELSTFAQDDWIVHRYRGIGQAEGIQTIAIGEEEKRYLKIDAIDGTIWLPEDKMTSEWLRSVATPKEIESALHILETAPVPMSDNLKSRQSRIKNTYANDEPVEIAIVLRDLWASKHEKKTLSQIEEESLRRLTECFLKEWSVSLGIPIEQARVKFKELLHKGRTLELEAAADAEL